jgi:hypothetical protein
MSEDNLLSPTMGKGHFDQNSPLSLYAKLGPMWAGRFMGKLAELPGVDDFIADETALKEWLRGIQKFVPNGTDHRYRLQFWLEYENACRRNVKMNMANVYSLSGPECTFMSLVLKDARRVAWMLCKPISYESHTKQILATGLSRLEAALEIDPFADPKKPDLKLLAMQIKITQMMDLRQHGAPTQKIQALSISAALDANGEIQGLVDKGDHKAILERMELLRKRKAKAQGRGERPPAEGEAAPSVVVEPAEYPEKNSKPSEPIDAEVVE